VKEVKGEEERRGKETRRKKGSGIKRIHAFV
jgi:hypothetical protein